MSAFTVINLDRLPAPKFIEQPSFEEIFEARKARLLELVGEFGGADQKAQVRQTLELESEPLVLLLQEDSYRELMLRAAVQDAGKSRLLAYAKGATLDHIAVEYGVKRLVVQEADEAANPPLPEILETDERFRARIQLAPEAFTTGGTKGDYQFMTMTASPAILDVDVSDDSNSGRVDITVLTSEGDGVADQALIDLVTEYLTDDSRRRLCDTVTVYPATLVDFTVEATLTFYNGPDPALVRQNAEAAVAAYLAEHRKLGHDITLSGLYAALHQEGVQKVTLVSPAADIVTDSGQVGNCTSVVVTEGGVDV